MSQLLAAHKLAAGAEISGPVRRMTAERIEWYGSGLKSAGRNELTPVGSNIHTDETYAKSQGLSAVIADGMVSTNWISSMLVQHFGMDYVTRGELRTKYIKPIFLGARVLVRGRVRSAKDTANGDILYDLDVWCEDEHGVKLTIGDAKIEIVSRS